MRIRSSGRLLPLVQLGFVGMVIILAMLGSEAFGQQKSSRDNSKSTAKSKSGGEVRKDENRANSIGPVIVEAGREQLPPPYTGPGAPSSEMPRDPDNQPRQGGGSASSPNLPPPTIIDHPAFCICKWRETVNGSTTYPPCTNPVFENHDYSLNYDARLSGPANERKPVPVICFNGEVVTWSMRLDISINDGCGSVSTSHFHYSGSGASVPRRCAGN